MPVHISAEAHVGYKAVELKDQDTLTVGDAVVRFLETPGHTPDSMCGVVSAKSQPDKPLALLSRATRCSSAASAGQTCWARAWPPRRWRPMMFDTWTNKLSKLPDETKVLPAHGAGSLCGAHLSDAPSRPSASSGRESVPATQEPRRIRGGVLEGLPEAPQYFAHNAALNRDGPEPVEWNRRCCRWSSRQRT